MDIQIFPHRILSADTTEKILIELNELENINRIVLQGQRLPDDPSNPDRRSITVKGEEIDLQIKTGRILMEIVDEDVIEDVKVIAKKHLPFGFNVYAGTFIRKEKTVSDLMKYGDLDNLPDDMVGLTDQNAELSKRATYLKKSL